MSDIKRQLVEESLIELSSLSMQVRQWISTDAQKGSSIFRATDRLLLDSGLRDPLHAGYTGYGEEFDGSLLELEQLLISVDAHQMPELLIHSHQMGQIRKVASKALSSLYVDNRMVEKSLMELGSLSEQMQLWLSSGCGGVSSFEEAASSLLYYSDLNVHLHTGDTGYGHVCEHYLLELETLIMTMDWQQEPHALIHSPDMIKVREVASKALSAFVTVMRP